MMRKAFLRLLLGASLLLTAGPESFAEPGAKHFDFTPGCREAYQEIIHLRLEPGRLLLEAEKQKDPSNLVPVFLENYIDFFLLFFNEDPAEFVRRKPGMERRLALMKQGDAGSPYTLFTRSIIYFQWAAVQIKFGYRWDAAWSFRRAFVSGKENLDRFPGFSPSQMLQGALQVAAGTIPPGYQWVSNLLGIRGTVSGGMKLLEGMLRSPAPDAVLFHDEAVFYYCYLRFYILNDKEGVFLYLKSQPQIDTRSNHLFAFLAANLSLNNHHAAEAAAIIRRRSTGPEYADLPLWDMEMGYALADHLDGAAIPLLERYLERFKGKFYVKESLQKLAWLYYLGGDLPRATATRERLKVSGSQESESDKQAMKEAESGRWPTPVLLKARMLDDGGYFKEALTLLQENKAATFVNETDRLEYNYRTGRLYDALNRKDEAILAYDETIRAGLRRHEYFAASAALQTGYIYELRKDYKRAREYFHQVLEMKTTEYKNSLDQKAKAGLARCGNEADN